MTRTVILAMALGLMLGGCEVGPGFTPPLPPAVTAYTAPGDAPPPADQSVTLGQAGAADWWTTLHAPALDRLIARAMANNPDVAIAQARLDEARESVKSAQAGLLPEASLGASAGRQKYGASLFGPLDISVPPFTYYVVGPSVSFPLDLFGGQRRTVEEQSAYLAYRRGELDEVRLKLAANVAAEALALAEARDEARTVERILADDQQDIDLVKTAFDLGSGTRTQLLEAQSQMAEDQTLLPSLRQRQAIARHALAILVGDLPADWSAPDFGLDDFTLPGEIQAGLPSDLARRRPDIRAAEAELHGACAAIGVATADLYPKLVLTGTYTQQALNPGGLFDGEAGAWALAAGLTQPLFEGGRLKAQRQAAVDRYHAALATYRKTVLGAFGEVADALQAQAFDADQLRSEAAAAQAAADALDLARRSYGAGASGVLDVIDVQRRYTHAQIAVSRARAQRLLDTVQLDAALGGAAP